MNLHAPNEKSYLLNGNAGKKMSERMRGKKSKGFEGRVCLVMAVGVGGEAGWLMVPEDGLRDLERPLTSLTQQPPTLPLAFVQRGWLGF